MKNQFDLVIQSQHLFTIDEDKFVKYIEDTNIEAQGIKVRCKFSDKIEEIMVKIKKECGLEGQFYIIEAQRLQNTYCQLLNPFNDIEGSELVSESALTHLSTWMLIVDSPELYTTLKPFAGKDSVPMVVKARFEGQEFFLKLYSNMLVANFID